MRRRIACRLLVTLMLLAALPQGALAVDAQHTGRPTQVQAGTEVVIGSTARLAGFFGMGGWEENTADLEIRALLHSHRTVVISRGGTLTVNETAVKRSEIVTLADGSHAVTLWLADGLTYNDGSPLTARDYVFTLLLRASREFWALGAQPKPDDYLTGYAAYHDGSSKTFAGVRLNEAENSFTMHVLAGSIPYFYGEAIVALEPLPMHVIAPGCAIVDDGAGVYISPGEGEYTADLLRKTLLDPDEGYLFYPRVTSGPYQLVAYDAQNSRISLEANRRFAGNYEGMTPHIERIIFQTLPREDMVDSLASGEVHLLSRVMNADVVDRGKALVDANSGFSQSVYDRSGLAFLSFACEDGVASSLAVRRAVALALDKDALVAEATGGHGRRVYGFYGHGQWMLSHKFTDGGEAIDIEDALKALDIPQDVERAGALLAADGWRLDSGGNAYSGGGAVRYRRDALGGLQALTLRLAISEESGIAHAMAGAMADALFDVGINLEIYALPYESLLSQYYRWEGRQYDVFFLSSNFSYLFDPAYDFATGEEFQGALNKTGLRDAELEALALDMRQTARGDLNTYARRWLRFQQRFAQLLPVIPLYSNEYYDFYTSDLKGYEIEAWPGWSFVLPYAWMEEQPAPTAQTEGEEPNG